jgi:hypothetical protein
MVMAMVMVMDTTAGMVVMAGMVVTGVAIIMVGVVGVGEDWVGAAGEVRRSTSISDGAIRIMGMGTIHIIGMATIAPIMATIAYYYRRHYGYYRPYRHYRYHRWHHVRHHW